MGFSAYVWHPQAPDFSCTWFSHSTAFIAETALDPGRDFIIVPEILASVYVSHLKARGYRVGVFVQNPYLLHVDLRFGDPMNVRRCLHAADLVLSISRDTTELLREIFAIPESKILRQRCAVNPNLFKPDQKMKKISYLPRKRAQDVARWVSFLSLVLPAGWQLERIDGHPESGVAQHLAQSVIFASFSELEGLGLPPIEAALAGNIVIGYHGQGGKEYWEEPNFISVPEGDIREFVGSVLRACKAIDSGSMDLMGLNPGIKKLQSQFSEKAEREALADLVGQVASITTAKGH
jgi:glycosyltransferase involved in cell wall biosynthesis